MYIRNTLLLSALFFFDFSSAFAHESHSSNSQDKKWIINGCEVNGTFLRYQNDEVFIETDDHQIHHLPFGKFSEADRNFIVSRLNLINTLNHSPFPAKDGLFNHRQGFPGLLLMLFLFIWLYKRIPLLRTSLFIILIFSGFIFASFTDPDSIRQAFAPFSDYVRTFWDEEYFYVESNGIPNSHAMMVGISDHGWQQQVPIPQCYVGSNSWKIPLNPIIAANPIPVDEIHFTRGAIAIAVNGVPIFNPHTNTGVDAFLDGQLDEFGGHSGRADDYHYHTAPLHLSSEAALKLPIAYALDGFAVYGKFEPDGSAMMELDQNHGHSYSGLYHYHGTTTAPYMIGNMVGKVTEDATHQLIPQPSARPVRTEDWTPLRGALITGCIPNNIGNGYHLTYSLNGTQGYAIDYSWTGTNYTFAYITPTSNTKKNYFGFAQCPITDQVTGIEIESEDLFIYPNPFEDRFQFNKRPADEFFNLFDDKGSLIFSGGNIQEQDFGTLKSGVYFLTGTQNKKSYRLLKK